jgi:hypothetical protein
MREISRAPDGCLIAAGKYFENCGFISITRNRIDGNLHGRTALARGAAGTSSTGKGKTSALIDSALPPDPLLAAGPPFASERFCSPCNRVGNRREA